VDIDLGKSSPRQYEEYVSALKDIPGDIRVLINNAGLSHAMPVTFEDTTETEMENIIGVNTCGVLRVTKHTLPFMLKTRYNPYQTYIRTKKLIVNVGSFAGFAPTPVPSFPISIDVIAPCDVFRYEGFCCSLVTCH
jgi:17beta-estradiol 17-dehydrogenase / very-long-chain 3-oxoacyl-CoA reductase